MKKITRSDVEKLKAEAGVAGDLKMVAICDIALAYGESSASRSQANMNGYELLLLIEVADRARVSISTVRHWIRMGALSSVRPGRRRMVRSDELARFLAQQHPNPAR